MKKILSFVIVVAAVAMVSCGGKTTKPAEATDATVETTEQTVAQPADSTQMPADTTAQTPAAAPVQ